MAQILDYSAGYPGAEAIRDAGYAGVIRYLRKEGSSRVRPITAAELADMRAHGLDVALVYQAISTARILEGYEAGAHDARWALQQAAAIGVPEPRVIYFAADQDIDATELPRVLHYLNGAGWILGRERVGIYGEASVVDTALPNHATWGWQTAAWSGGRRAARAHLYQRIGQVLIGGISCDVNDVLRADYGQIQIEKGDEVSAAEVWTHPVPLFPDQDDPDQRTAAQAAEALGRSVQGAWASADYGKMANAKLDALLGRDPVDEVELAKELIAQGLGTQLGRLPEDQFVALVQAVANESDRRAAHRADVTVPAPGGGA